MRFFLVALLFCSLAGGQKKEHSRQGDNKSAQNNEATAPSPTSIQAITSATSQANANQQQRHAVAEPSPRPFLTHSEWIQGSLTFAYVIVSVMMWFTIRKQARHMQEQTEHMESQVAEMRAASEQAIKQVSELHSVAQAAQTSAEAARLSAKSAVETVALKEAELKQWLVLTSKGMIADVSWTDRKLRIGFDLVNPTRLPIVIESVFASFLGAFEKRQNVASLVTPDNSYEVWVSRGIEEHELEPYRRGQLILDLSCTVIFEDSRGARWEQSFGRSVQLRPGSGDQGIVRETKNELRAKHNE